MKTKLLPASGFRGKVIAAIIVLQAAMIAIFVSVQTYHEFLMVREYIKDANIQFARNLAHSFVPISYCWMGQTDTKDESSEMRLEQTLEFLEDLDCLTMVFGNVEANAREED